MTDFDTILAGWQAMKPSLLPIADMSDVELLDEFAFFCVEHKEAKGRNSIFNDNHLIQLFGELRRRNLFPE
jgi:hypothetical protein